MRPKQTGDVQALPLGSQLVTAIQGRPVSTETPPSGAALVWKGSAWVPGGRIAYGTRTSTVSTAGTTFGTGADLLSSALSFMADGSSDYLISVASSGWQNSTNATTQWLRINLDGADAGSIIGVTNLAAGVQYALAGLGFLTKPTAGNHTLNVRLMVSGGTGTVQGGTGGAGGNLPIIVTIEVA